jgi:GNAT superfamily N-acetyltransferase
MQIQALRDRPELFGPVATLIHHQWPYEFDGVSLTEWLEQFRSDEGEGRTTFVALEDSRLLGTACLDAEDLPQRPDLGPWLASVLVLPEARSRGLGTQLIERVEAEAWARGQPRLYLHTTDREGFYLRRGWHTLEHLRAWGLEIALMSQERPDLEQPHAG